jgi:hypothetical protein
MPAREEKDALGRCYNLGKEIMKTRTTSSITNAGQSNLASSHSWSEKPKGKTMTILGKLISLVVALIAI